MHSKEPKDLSNDYLQLARIAMTGRAQDIQFLVHRASKDYKDSNPKLATELISLLRESPTRTSPLRKQAEAPLPVDVDSRLQLLRIDHSFTEDKPQFSLHIENAITQLLSERRNEKALLKLGLHPTKSILFTGPPGVGKTLSAKWIASQLKRPLLVLDLAAVMSSYLGRTGNNIRFVLDYAKQTECVLLLDELDAIAKRRDDNSEVGELKRLVTVLLQEIDDWPPSGLLIAATNHPDLLDPAIWRRFELVLNFSIPSQEQIKNFVSELLTPHMDDPKPWDMILSLALTGKSYSDIEKLIIQARKASAMSNRHIEEELIAIVQNNLELSRAQRAELAFELSNRGTVSQRRAQEITGVARETIRKQNQKGKQKNG